MVGVTGIAAVFLLVLLAWALAPPQEGRRWVALDVVVYAALLAAGAGVSLLAFDAIDQHAFRAHEEQLHALFSGTAPPEGYHPAEVQVLIGWLYTQVGQRFGTGMDVFVKTAYLLGSPGIVLAGLAAHRLTGSRAAGYLVGALLVLHPTLAYWRVHGFHVAPAHAAFCGCLLGAALVADKPTVLRFCAWFGLGTLTAFLRMEYGLAVAATAAIPLLGGAAGALKKPWLWLPPLIVCALALGGHQRMMVGLLAEREDYRLGVRFLWLHLPLTAPWRPLASLGGLAGVAAALLACRHAGVRGRIAGLALTAVGGMLPLVFMDYGGRHLLPSTTAGLVLCVVGLRALSEGPERLRIAQVAGLVFCVGVAQASVSDLASMAPRYGDQSGDAPEVEGLARPSGDMPDGWTECAIYSNAMDICDASPNCHPLKDLRDPALVAQRWDDYGGCVYWAVDAQLDDVAGAQHEAWPVLQHLYPLEPVAEMALQPRGELRPNALVYRIAERPRGPGMRAKASLREEGDPNEP